VATESAVTLFPNAAAIHGDKPARHARQPSGDWARWRNLAGDLVAGATLAAIADLGAFHDNMPGAIVVAAIIFDSPDSASRRSGVSAPKPVEIHWATEERVHHYKERFYWRLAACLTSLAVFGAIATVIFSQLGLLEARRSTREASRLAVAAEYANRAFRLELRVLGKKTAGC
jgi:hypothetical protein